MQDASGGTYTVHCRKGKAFSIEIKYPGKGIERRIAVESMKRLVEGVAEKITEHDDTDVKTGDCLLKGEYFYFDGYIGAQLAYAPGDELRVSQIVVTIYPKKKSERAE